MAFVKPVVEHWLEREIAQWVHPRRIDPTTHRTMSERSYHGSNVKTTINKNPAHEYSYYGIQQLQMALLSNAIPALTCSCLCWTMWDLSWKYDWNLDGQYWQMYELSMNTLKFESGDPTGEFWKQ